MDSLRDKHILKAFGENLKKIRESKKISQQKLATAINSFQSTIIRIEKGESDPKLCTICAIAKALKTQPMQLLNYSTF